MGEEMFRLRDRRGADLALGMTHEEIFATLAAELQLVPRAAAAAGTSSRPSSATSRGPRPA